jgi:hypothetical protein
MQNSNNRALLEKLIVHQLFKKFDTKGLLPCSQEPATCPSSARSIQSMLHIPCVPSLQTELCQEIYFLKSNHDMFNKLCLPRYYSQFSNIFLRGFIRCSPANIWLCSTGCWLEETLGTTVLVQRIHGDNTDGSVYFTFMLPCILIDFFLNNQPDAPIIQIHSVIKLYMFWASSLPIIRSFLLYIRHSSILTLLGSGHQILHET